jgi:hypothetical protein
MALRDANMDIIALLSACAMGNGSTSYVHWTRFGLMMLDSLWLL